MPVLYSYRRCPYAMRARIALKYAGIIVEIREIVLKDKPIEMLKVSPKATVPVLVLNDDTVIEQSLDIMLWALQQQDKDGWLSADRLMTEKMIAENDASFKQALDKYKYAIRFPEQSVEVYRAKGEEFLQKLEKRLNQSPFLLGDQISLADIAIFPFVRQFSTVDSAWFHGGELKITQYPKLNVWLKGFIESKLFISIMEKQPAYVA